MATTVIRRHWLIDLAIRRGCPVPAELAAPNPSPIDVWAEVARSWGVSPEEPARRVAAHFPDRSNS